MSLQAELEQIISLIGYGPGGDRESQPGLTEAKALKAILATVSKHLPEKITAGDIAKGIPANYSRHDNADTQKGYNTAITEMEKTLGGNDK